MEPTFVNIKKKFEDHLRKLINQPIREFQIYFEIKIKSVQIELKDGRVNQVNVKLK